MQRTLRLARHSTTIIIVGATSMGFISGKLLLFNGSAMNVRPWGILAIATSSFASTGRQAIKLGGVFGFVVSFSFLCFNNTGTKTMSAAVMVALLAAVAALFGLLCGALLTWLGWKARELYRVYAKNHRY